MSALFPLLHAPHDGAVLRVGDRTVTARELAAACSAHAEQLRQAGVSPGAHVAVWTQPRLETAVALVANAVAGVVSLPLDPKLGDFELGHLMREAAPVLALAAEPEAVRARLPALTTLTATLGNSSTTPPARLVDDAPMLILPTSGTTGLPKGAVLSSRNAAFCIDALADAWRWTANDTVVHALPLFHVHGLVLGLFGALRVGGALHWVPKFDAAEVAQALAARQSMLFAVPTMYHRLTDASAEVVAQVAKARVLVSGSAALPLRDQLRIEALTGKRVVERYGLTETLINTAVRVGGEGRAGSVGPALRGVELRLVDDARQPLSARDDRTIGEVAVRGPNIFLGYLNRPEATAAARDADGWFYTGDLACMAADGSLRIVGRRAVDLIKCGGYRVGAGEVEAALLEHPSVREAAVLGVPHDDLGEAIVAFVVAGTPVEPAALSDFVAAQLSPHKRPRTVHLVAELPRNAMGKVQKVELKKRLTEGKAP